MDYEKVCKFLMKLFLVLSWACAIFSTFSALFLSSDHRRLICNVVLIVNIYAAAMYFLFSHIYFKNLQIDIDETEKQIFEKLDELRIRDEVEKCIKKVEESKNSLYSLGIVFVLSFLYVVNFPSSHLIYLERESVMNKAMKKYRKEFRNSYKDLYNYIAHKHPILYVDDGNSVQEAFNEDIFVAFVMVGCPYTFDNGNAYVKIERDSLERKKNEIIDMMNNILPASTVDKQNQLADELRRICFGR